MKKILVIGSINIDQVISVNSLPKNGETILGKKINYHSGGKGANQAVAIAKMNCDTKLLAAVGNDEWGKFCTKACNQYNVDTSRIINVENQKTGLASIYVQNDGLNSIVLLAGANEYLTKKVIDENIDLIQECDYLVTQLETNHDGVFYAMQKAKEYGKTTILNPAPAKILSIENLQYCDFLIPNETELATISSIEINNEKQLHLAFEKILKQNNDLKLITTFGSKGIYYYDKANSKVVNFPALKTNVVDTTAAGDSFIGGFVSKLSKGSSIEEAINFGIKVASITVSRNGAQESIPLYEEVNNEKK